jgi:RNA polymerase sigma-70 factor, ECF subfamily
MRAATDIAPSKGWAWSQGGKTGSIVDQLRWGGGDYHGQETVAAARLILLSPSPDAEPDDVALVAALRRKEPRAELIAWRRFAPHVTRTLRRLMGPGGDEEDLSQEVFLRFFRKVGGLREPSAVRGFLTGICLRVVRRELRRRWLRRWLKITDRGVVPDVAGPVEDQEAREVVRRYYQILDRVGAEERSLFVARHLEGLGLAEVAELHGISVSTTQRKLARVGERVSAMIRKDPIVSEYLAQHGGIR